MLTIDCQVHCYERNRPERPWSGHLEGPEEVTGDDMVAAMDAVGVDGAILISPFSLYQYDASYALEVYAKHPGRFGLVRPFDPESDTVADEVAEWTSTTGVVGARVMLAYGDYEADNPGLNAMFAACARAGVPVNVMAAGKLPLLAELARRNADTQVIIDHVGLAQPFVPPGSAGAVRGPAERAGCGGAGQRGYQDLGARARCRTSRSPTPTSGTRSAGCSTPTGWSGVCGAPTGRGPCGC